MKLQFEKCRSFLVCLPLSFGLAHCIRFFSLESVVASKIGVSSLNTREVCNYKSCCYCPSLRHIYIVHYSPLLPHSEGALHGPEAKKKRISPKLPQLVLIYHHLQLCIHVSIISESLASCRGGAVELWCE